MVYLKAVFGSIWVKNQTIKETQEVGRYHPFSTKMFLIQSDLLSELSKDFIVTYF